MPYALKSLDPSRTDLACEYRDNPFGPWSPALQKVLQILRWMPLEGRRVLVCTSPGREWRIGILPGRRGRPIEYELEPMHSLSLARWRLFKRRWELITGMTLEVGDRPTGDREPATTSAPEASQ